MILDPVFAEARARTLRARYLPRGLSYPSTDKRDGNRPPQPECAPRWHRRGLDGMKATQPTLLIGQYAHRCYLGSRGEQSITKTLRAWQVYGREVLLLPHANWPSAFWLRIDS